MFDPIDVNELFELNPDYKVESFENGVLVIDDWYKNYEEIHEVLQNATPVKWKGNIEGSRNFKDYYDCRHFIQNKDAGEKYQLMINTISELIKKHWNVPYDIGYANDPVLDFNYYSGLKENVKDSMQFAPHVDADFSVLIYMDKISNGGTGIYNTVVQEDESKTLLFDMETQSPNTKYQMVDIAEAKPNRLVIFPGTQRHGGVIFDHKSYYKKWRINQVIFAYVNTQQGEICQK